MGADGSHSNNVPPPFLTKTYEMVDDPATDEIVSWSDNNNSFVVWNVADFTKDLLPQFFKHNNFSSFVRQLNTYGFHKIDPDRQEFANEGFSKGNKEALKYIHRRKPTTSHTHTSQKELSLAGCSDPGHAELEEEIKTLKHDKGLLVDELMKMKELQESTEMGIETLGQRLQVLEKRQQGIMMIVSRAMHHPCFAQFMQQTEGLAFNKKRRLPEQEVLIGIGDSWVENAGHGHLMSGGMLTELDGPLESESSYEHVLKQLAGSTLNQPEETSPLSQTSKASLWEMPMSATGGEHVPSVDSAEQSEAHLESKGSGYLSAWNASDVHARISGNGVGHDEGKPIRVHVDDGSEGKKNDRSNDVFWENMLSENPRSLERDSEDCRSDGHAHERWFL